MLGYVSQTAMSASSLANQYTFIRICLYTLRYGHRNFGLVCPVTGEKGDKKTVEKILASGRTNITDQFFDIFHYLIFHANYDHEDF